MGLISDMRLFVQVVSRGSLSAAGRQCGLSPGAVSQRLKALETRYATTFLNRSSRSLSLTEEGRIFLESAQRMLAEAETLDASLQVKRTGLTGRLRVAAPCDFGRQVVEPLVRSFSEQHQTLCVELHLNDALEDVVTDDFDVTFRYGALQDSTLIARSLGLNRLVLVAAPHYFAARGLPEHPGELEGHDCLVLKRGNERLDRWIFTVEGEDVAYKVHARLAVNDGDILRQWALAGYGIAMKSLRDVQGDIDAGRLQEALPQFTWRDSGVHLLYASSRRHTPRVRAFVEAALQHCARQEAGS